MATSIIKVHTFSGSQSEGPPCYLLQIDEFHFLLDCGWDEDFTPGFIYEVKKYVKLIDAVLVSHPNPHHLGGLPFLVGKCGLRCPVYATTPVYKMGQMFMYDAYQSRQTAEDFTLFSLDDVDAAFELVVQVKYQQTINLHGKGQGLSITPLPAGHMLGGTIWKIMKDDTDIVYAIDYNHKKERHLNGAAFDSCLRPHLLITDAGNALYSQSRRRTRDELLMKSIMQTLRRGGNVLIAVDTAGRCLELAHLLEQLWHNQDSGLMAYGLALLNHVAYNVVEFAKSQVEWMSEKVMRAFEDQRTNPFTFRHMQLCHAIEQLENVPEPKVVLASSPDLQCGFSRQLFAKWCENENNTVILTQRCSLGTLARTLIDDPPTKPLHMDLRRRVRLVGDELEEYLEMRRTQDALTPSGGAGEASLLNSSVIDPDISRRRLDDLSMLEADDSSEDEMMIEEVTGSTTLASTAGNTTLTGQLVHHQPSQIDPATGRHQNAYDIVPGAHTHSGGQWFRATKRTQMLFPFTEKKRIWDEYGEKIDNADFTVPLDDPEISARKDLTDYSNKGKQIKRSNSILTTNSTSSTTPGTLLPPHPSTLASQMSMATPTATELSEVPTNCVIESLSLDVKCTILYIDFEGRSDGEAMKKIINSFRPQEVILVRGSANATNQLAEYCRTAMQLSPDMIHTPCVGDTVDCTKEGNIYQARMKDSLVSSLTFFKIRDYELAWIDADVVMEMGTNSSTDVMIQGSDDGVVGGIGGGGGVGGDQMNSGGGEGGLAVLVPPESRVEDHSTVFVNEPKLSDVKQILLKHGMNAEFLSGVLVVDNCVAIKRSEAGKLLLEGTISETYFNVRTLLYSQFAIL